MANSTIPALSVLFGLSRGIPIEELEETIESPVLKITHSNQMVADDLPPRIMKYISESQLISAPALEMAEAAPFSMLGGVERAAAFAPDGRAILELFSKYGKLNAGRSETWIEETASFISINFSHPLDSCDDGILSESQVSLILCLLRHVIGANAKLIEAHFGFSSHGSRDRYREFFQAPVSFGRNYGEHSLVFGKDLLYKENIKYNYTLFESSRIYLQELLGNIEVDGRSGAYQRVLTAVSFCSENSDFSASAIALAAGMSLRVAQLVVQQQGVSLRRLIDEERAKKAKHLILNEAGIRFEAIAIELGYSDERAFRRFFKRVVGMSPAEYRAGVFHGP